MEYAEGISPMLWLIWIGPKLGEEKAEGENITEFQHQKGEKEEHSVHAYSRY